MLDAEAAFVLDLMEKATAAGRPQLHTLGAAEARAMADKLSADGEADPPAVARVSDGTLPGPGGPIAFRRYWPAGVEDKPIPTLVYYHGGGFVIGNLETHDSTCRRLANKSRCQVIAIDYRLAPEHPFPAPVEDALIAFRHIRDHAGNFDTLPDKIAVGGDSAGGNLAAVVCQQTKSAGERMPAFQMLIYPATDSATQSHSRRTLGDRYFLTDALIDWFFRHYLPTGVDLSDLRVSPLLAKDFTGLPAAYVLTAGYDPLKDEGHAYAEKLRQAGVKVTYANFPGTLHGFFSMTRFLKQGLVANDEAAGVLAAFLGR
ncbi:MAG: alpha/beta hydrolase [Alphaproteobacteria bacterium]|nr:alpha/beta hydrolase [Alphaproteobacteria bacterium]